MTTPADIAEQRSVDDLRERWEQARHLADQRRNAWQEAHHAAAAAYRRYMAAVGTPNGRIITTERRP